MAMTVEVRNLWRSDDTNWELNLHKRDDGSEYVVLTDGWFCDYPLLLDDNNNVAYDYPERIPSYVHEAVRCVLAKPKPKRKRKLDLLKALREQVAANNYAKFLYYDPIKDTYCAIGQLICLNGFRDDLHTHMHNHNHNHNKMHIDEFADVYPRMYQSLLDAGFDHSELYGLQMLNDAYDQPRFLEYLDRLIREEEQKQ